MHIIKRLIIFISFFYVKKKNQTVKRDKNKQKVLIQFSIILTKINHNVSLVVINILLNRLTYYFFNS